MSWKAFDESKSPDVSFQELFPAADLFAGSRSRPGSSNQLSKPAGSRDQQLDRVSCTPTVRLSEVVVTNSVCPSSQVIMKSREDMRLVNYSGKAANSPALVRASGQSHLSSPRGSYGSVHLVCERTTQQKKA